MSKSGRRLLATTREQMLSLMAVALGEAEADLAITNGTIVNVYTGELLTGDTVLVKGDRIAYVGRNTGKAIGPGTRVIDAAGKTLVPGFIDGHTHTDYPFPISELLRYAMKGGTTTIVTEVGAAVFSLGMEGITQFRRAIRHQPIKVLLAAPPMVTISPAAESGALTAADIRRLFRWEEFIALGEPYWAAVVDRSPRQLDLMAEASRLGKRIDGHSSGASDNKVQAYVAAGITSCHEPTTAQEALEKLRLGLCIMAREGEVRRELEGIAPLGKQKIDFRMMGLVTDGLGPWQIVDDGYMEFVVQKMINLGFDPVVAIQMATLNVAQHFTIDSFIGGIAPGRYADILIIPDIRTIRPEYVISNGQVVSRNGELLVQPRKHRYPEAFKHSIKLPREFTAADFAISVDGPRSQVPVRLMKFATPILTKAAVTELPVVNGQLRIDTGRDILKAAAIDHTHMPGKTFTGLVQGVGLKKGAVAVTTSWDAGDLIVVGADEDDMARAVNRLREIQGGLVIYAGGEKRAEVPLPIGGWVSTESMETISDQLHRAQEEAAKLGFPYDDVRLTVSVLTASAIAFLRLSEHGLVDLKSNRLVSLIAD